MTPLPPSAPEVEPVAARRRLTARLAGIARDRALLFSLGTILLLVLVAIFAPWLSPYDPADAAAPKPNMPIGSPGFLLGSDNQGRDMLSRILWGARISLLVALVPTVIATVISIAVGLLTGLLGGLLDAVVSSILDVLFAFPIVLLAIAIAGVLEPGVTTVILSITVVLVPYVTRVARTATLQVRQLPYIEAARASGGSFADIALRYVLPNMINPVLVYATTLVGLMIVVGAGLSFLGLGAQPPAADWGAMVGEGSGVLRRAPQVSLLPGALIAITALAFNLLGDQLRNRFDPRASR